MSRLWFKLYGLAALAATVGAACSLSSSPPSAPGWSNRNSAAEGGGMQALVNAAQAEGRLTIIALPRDWANYGAIIDAFQSRYDIRVNSVNPNGDSRDEIGAVNHGGNSAPDVLDLNMTAALANTGLFSPYQVSTWGDIPSEQKDTSGLWYQDYGGYMSIGYDSSKVPAISSVDDLAAPAFKGKVALEGDPNVDSTALSGVMMVSLVEGGSLDHIGPGVDFFHKLKLVGNFLPVQATTATINSGQTPVVLDWDYLSQPRVQDVPTWTIFVPSDAVLGSFYAQAINKMAPHPAAARLWEEYLYSNAGQTAWLRGGVRPVRMAALQAAGLIQIGTPNLLAPVSGTPVFLNASQISAAHAYLASHWQQAVG
jgi:putative spermidine/putrescine transport system substrate-binding protein